MMKQNFNDNVSSGPSLTLVEFIDALNGCVNGNEDSCKNCKQLFNQLNSQNSNA